MTNQVIAHVDMDCFFAACEMKKDPALKGKPLIIGGHKDTPRGVVSTASYEAREFGVHSAMPISKAAKLCPEGVFIPSDHKYYSLESKEIMSVLFSVASDFQQVSIDEAYLDITEFVKRFDSWKRAGEFIQHLVLKRTSYTCSIGISESKRVAKIASDYKKPAGITVVSDMKSFLAPLQIKQIPGIGKKSLPYYHKLGIETIGDFASKSKFFILDNFGMHGISTWNLANGLDFSTIEHYGERKSISNETTFDIDIKVKEKIESELQDLAKYVHSRLKDFVFKTISIKIRYADFTTITRSLSLPVSSSSIDPVIAAFPKLLSDVAYLKGIRLIGVKLDNLTKVSSTQLALGDF